jgi:hypothetical protein
VPKLILPEPGFILWSQNWLVAFRLDELDKALEKTLSLGEVYSSVQVERWFGHMDEWRQEKMPSGIAVLVLHRPGMDIGASAFVMRDMERGEFYGRQCNNGVRAG